MYYVYLIKSGIRNYCYTGCTDDYTKRLREHNNGEVISTKVYRPFEVIYYEACLDKKDAYNREKYLKSRRGKLFLKDRLKNWFSKKKA